METVEITNYERYKSRRWHIYIVKKTRKNYGTVSTAKAAKTLGTSVQKANMLLKALAIKRFTPQILAELDIAGAMGQSGIDKYLKNLVGDSSETN
jgi:hypothetical protein